MKRFTKLALGALMLAGAATAAASPASARVVVGFGAPIVYAPGPVCKPYSAYYNPYYCGPADGAVVGIGFGGWHDGWHGGGYHGVGFHAGGFFHGGGFHGGFRGGHH